MFVYKDYYREPDCYSFLGEYLHRGALKPVWRFGGTKNQNLLRLRLSSYQKAYAILRKFKKKSKRLKGAGESVFVPHTTKEKA